MVVESVWPVGEWWGVEPDRAGEIPSLEHWAMDLGSTANDVSCLVVTQMQSMPGITEPSAQLDGKSLVLLGAISQGRGQRSDPTLIRRGHFELCQRRIEWRITSECFVHQGSQGGPGLFASFATRAGSDGSDRSDQEGH